MNVHRHARARSVGVLLRYEDQQVSLQVEDDGVGLSDPAVRSVGVGVSGMQARMTQLDGRITLEPGLVGLRVVASAPARTVAAPQQPVRSGLSDADILMSAPIQGIA